MTVSIMVALVCGPLAAPLQAAPDTGQALLREGRTANAAGQFERAEAAFRAALAEEAAAAPDVQGATLLELALNVSNQDRRDEAAALFRRAEPLIATAPDGSLRARLTTYLAVDAANRRDFPAARRFARAAADAWAALAAGRVAAGEADDDGQAAAWRAEQANALTLLGKVDLRLGDVAAGYAAASEALLILNTDRSAPRWWLADAFATLAEISLRMDRVSAAQTYAARAVAIRRGLFGDGAPTIAALALAAAADEQAGLHDRGIGGYREAFALAAKLPRAAGLRSDDLLPYVDAVRAQRGGDALVAFQLAGSPVIDRTVAQVTRRRAASDPALAAAIAAAQTSERDLAAVRLRLAAIEALPDDERPAADEAALRGQAKTLAETTAARFAAVRRTAPALARLADPEPVTLAALQATLAPGEAVVAFLVGRERSAVQFVTRETAVLAPVGAGRDEIEAAVAALRRPFDDPRRLAAFDLAGAARLHQLLLGGLGDAMRGVRQLTVIADGPVANLPFALLVADPAAAGEDYARAHWLVRDRAIAYAPSIASLVAMRTGPVRAPAPQPMIAFADPLLRGGGAPAGIGAMCRSGEAIPAAVIEGLAPLPDTAAEVRAVARATGGSPDRLFLGAAATQANVRAQRLSDYRLVYFATHAVLPGELKCRNEPGLVLTPAPGTHDRADDGLLDASEIAALRLDADLVVLSACDSAGNGGEALSGLAEAFLFAGARDLVVSHWQVASQPTTQLMTDLFVRTPATGGIAERLRRAQLAAIERPATAHPFFWAAFVPIGEVGAAPARIATR